MAEVVLCLVGIVVFLELSVDVTLEEGLAEFFEQILSVGSRIS